MKDALETRQALETQVIGCGLPRSGSTSLKAALKILGYTPGVDMMVGDSVCLPLNRYQSLDKQHPNTKFIFTYRKSAETWLASVNKRTEVIKNNPGVLRQRKSMYGSAEVVPEIYLPLYWQREIEVRDYFLKEYGEFVDNKLLCVCWELGSDQSNWNQLCQFLDKPIPTISFPHINKSK